jgi:hypothetical protein
MVLYEEMNPGAVVERGTILGPSPSLNSNLCNDWNGTTTSFDTQLNQKVLVRVRVALHGHAARRKE